MNEDLGKTKKRALKILGSRNFSQQEMVKRLINKGESEYNAQETVSWLVSLGYINDESYALMIVEYYSSRGYGLMRVKDELYKRGIPRDLWESVLTAIDDESVNESALKFLEKRLRGSTDESDIRKAKDSLVRRGFNYDEAKNAIITYISNLES